MDKDKLGKIILYVSVMCAIIIGLVNKLIIPIHHTVYYLLILVCVIGTMAGWLIYSEAKKESDDDK